MTPKLSGRGVSQRKRLFGGGGVCVCVCVAKRGMCGQLNTTEHDSLIASAKQALASHLAEVSADDTKAKPQLNSCNEALALWPPAQRAASKPLDRVYLCTYEG